ncbi:MAG: sigma-70 family RNA polymerase sigma factor [Sphingomonas sp.]|uniref:RNA polymerase sigma factor n=1 Tax=Sphingomonas sp. TaxID=28214 RepID=UPI003565376A
MRSIRDSISRLKQTLVRRGVSVHDAEDFVQEAYLRLEERARDGTVVEHPEGYIVRAALNIAIDSSRHHRRWQTADTPVEELGLTDESPLPDEVLASRRRLSHLSAGFEALDSVTRAIVVAKKMEGLKVAEIAERQGLSVSAVEKRLARGMVFLMAWMEER